MAMKMKTTMMKIKMMKIKQIRNQLKIKKKNQMPLKKKLEKGSTISHLQSWTMQLEILSMSTELLKRLKMMS